MGIGWINVPTLLFSFLLCFQTASAGWGEWSPWTSCSVSCGNGIQTRTKYCTDEPDKNVHCFFANVSTEQYQCYSGVNCPKVNGGWSSWRPWGNCSRKCGIGFHERWRECNNPVPRYGGKHCEGSPQESAPCINPACPPLYFGDAQTTCLDGQVHCADGRECVAEFRRCDFYLDCEDGSDESACRDGEPVEIYIFNHSGIMSNIGSVTFPLTLALLSVYVSLFAEVGL